MKATLEFDLNDPEDKTKHLQCVKAENMAIALFEITHNLKKQLLAECEGDGIDDPEELIELFMQHILIIMNNHDINTEKLC